MPGLTTPEREKLAKLRKQVRELSADWVRSRSPAACRMVLRSSRTRQIAPALNSSVEDLRERSDGVAALDSWSIWDTVPAFHLVSTKRIKPRDQFARVEDSPASLRRFTTWRGHREKRSTGGGGHCRRGLHADHDDAGHAHAESRFL
jgi:hypothetical protein